MNLNSPLSAILRTNCTIIESAADIEIVKSVFDHFPYQYLPVVEGLKFVGVIMRDEFYQKFVTSNEWFLSASELISKEVVCLSTENTIAQAKEVFDTKIFDLIAVTDEDDDLAGVVLREDVEAVIHQKERQQGVFAEIRRIFSFFSF